MKLGTQIRFSDGRVGTIVYCSLIGDGIMWGMHDPNPADFMNTDGNTIAAGCPDDWPWNPEALLRDPWEGCDCHGFTAEQCVGRDFEIIREGRG